jgi:signal transduction histidine kinase
MQESSMNPGIAFICDHNGIVQKVVRDDFSIFGAPGQSGNHLSRYVTASSKEAATRFFIMLSTDGVSASRPIEFVTNGTSRPLFCTGMRLRDCFLIFGTSSRSNLGPLISDILYSNDDPIDFSQVCGTDFSPDSKRLPDYQVYEDLTRLNNELVNMSRELTDAQVEIEMEADELHKEVKVRKQTEEALSLANKKLNLLSSITRHDINNQLTILMGYLTILEKQIPDTSFSDYFLKVSNAAKRISSMIKFTKEYEEIGVKAPTWQDTRTLIDTAAKQAPLGKVMVKNDLPAGAEVFADPLVVKVFYNLMDNAVRYGGKITTIQFSVQESGDDHMIVCEDDGDGIVAAEKEKIFERGFGKNTGLGLALSREILDITGITIRETGEPGKGARFEMTVPKGVWRMNVDTDLGKNEFDMKPVIS